MIWARLPAAPTLVSDGPYHEDDPLTTVLKQLQETLTRRSAVMAPDPDRLEVHIHGATFPPPPRARTVGPHHRASPAMHLGNAG